MRVRILPVLFAICFLALPALAGVEDAVILNNDGVDLYTRGFYTAAIDRFQAALTYDANNPQIYTNMGYAYMASNMPEYAVESFRKALAIDPTNLDVHNNLAISLYTLGKRDQAIEEWEFVLRTDPNFEAAKRNLELAYAGKRLAPAGEEIYYTGSHGEPFVNYDELADMFDRGKLAYKRGNFGEAIELLSNVLEVKPTSKFSHFYLGLAYARMGKSDQAMTHLREYLVRETTPPESSSAYDHAEKVFQNLRKGYTYVDMLEFDDTAASYYDQGKNAYEKGDYFRAIHFLRRAVDLAPGSFSSNYLLGLGYRHVGDRERAVYHLSRALYSVEAEKYSDNTLKKVEDLLNSLSQGGD